MPIPSHEFLRHTVGPWIDGYQATLLKASLAGSSVHRLSLQGSGDAQPPSMILKRIPADQTASPGCAPREVRFYQEILPGLNIPHPHVFYVGLEPASTGLILMEDLRATHSFPDPHHVWTAAELRSVLRAYARLHTAGESRLQEFGECDWLIGYRPQDLPFDKYASIAKTLADEDVWPDAPPLMRLVDELHRLAATLDDPPPTVIHNDLYPPNVGLPHSGDEPAVLIDWDLAGCGLAELDLAYLRLQPFCSAIASTARQALDCYWQERRSLVGRLPSARTRQMRQRYADLLLALWFVPGLAQVAAHPFPVDSAADAYWRAMRGVLHARLTALATGVGDE